MARSRWIVLGTVLCACGGNAEKNGGSANSDAGPATSSNTHTASTVTAVTSSATNSVTTGTGGTGPIGCSSLEPAPGTGCEEEGTSCSYPNCSPPDYRDGHDLVCQNGAWSITNTWICDVDGMCPASPPPLGSSCFGSAATGPCTIVDGCGAYGMGVCNGGYWALVNASDLPASTSSGGAGSGAAPPPNTTSGELPQCPASPPVAGASCCPNSFPPVCNYDETSTSGGAAGASFIILPEDRPGSTSGGDPAILSCAVCSSASMRWESCPQ